VNSQRPFLRGATHGSLGMQVTNAQSGADFCAGTVSVHAVPSRGFSSTIGDPADRRRKVFVQGSYARGMSQASACTMCLHQLRFVTDWRSRMRKTLLHADSTKTRLSYSLVQLLSHAAACTCILSCALACFLHQTSTTSRRCTLMF
jgi:hypothetical protein